MSVSDSVHRLELANSVGGEPALLGLTAVFKDFYPDIILSNAVVGRSKAFIVCKQAEENGLVC